MENYSVLMSVYDREDPRDLTAAIRSMLDQTVVTNDFVIVCDGPLTAELDAVLEDFISANPGLFQILRLPENVGVGMAAQAGLAVCRNELVAKMDSDDISLPCRCEKQLEKFAANPDLCLLGGMIEEFDNRTGQVIAARCVPLDNAGIRHYARRRSPINNVTAMYKKSAVVAAGGYRALRRGEDYDLYLRMLINGCYAENLPQTLVKVRVDADTHRGRVSWRAVRDCADIRLYAWHAGFSSLADVVICVAGQVFLAVCPGRVQELMYKLFLRKKSN